MAVFYKYDGKYRQAKEGDATHALLTVDEFRDLSKQIKAAEEKTAKERLLNENLLRICRERANQRRGITPKRTHDGYLVLSAREWSERTAGGRARAWRTTIQTPYDASLPEAGVIPRIVADLKGGVLQDIGCSGIADDGRYPVAADRCMMYRGTFGADYRSGFWLVTIFTNKQLTVPVERRTFATKRGDFYGKKKH